MRWPAKCAAWAVAWVLLSGFALPDRTNAQTTPIERLQINAAIQDALAWTGDYAILADGEIGPKTVQAIAEFQRRQGWTPSGDLDAAQTLRLLHIADEARRQVGFQLVSDPRSMLAIGLPTRL